MVNMFKKMDKKKLVIIGSGFAVLALIILGIVMTGSITGKWKSNIFGDVQYSCSEWKVSSSGWKSGAPSSGSSTVDPPSSCTTQTYYSKVTVYTDVPTCTTNTGSSQVPCYYEEVYTRTRTATQCDTGYYLTNGTCYECEAGYYCEDGKTKTTCPVGSTSEIGATSKDDCTPTWTFDLLSYSTTLNIGETYTIEFSVDGIETAENEHHISYVSNNEDVATTDHQEVTAVGSGTTTITVTLTINGISQTKNFTVYVDSSSSTPTLTCPSSLYVGATGNCSINNGNLTGGVTSSAAEIASVSSTSSSSFTIKGLKEGDVIFTANINGQSITSNVVQILETTIPVTSVSVSCTSSSITEGSNTNCTATILPTNATSQSVVWSSSDSSVAGVDQSGYVTAKTSGSVVITAKSSTDASKYGTFDITVNAKAQLDVIEGENIIAIAADVGSVTAPYGAKDTNKEYIKVDWSASGANAMLTDCTNTTSCQITFSHSGNTSGVSSVNATVSASVGDITKNYDVKVYSYCAWTLVDSNKGPYSDSQYASMNKTRDSMKYVTGCDAYEGFHRESDGWYYVNHYNRCCSSGGGETPLTPSCYVNETTNDYKWATSSPGDGYVIDETIDSSEECVAEEEPEYCYKKIGNGTQNTYCYGTSDECTGYSQKVDDVNDSLSCTETPACYQTTSGSYVTGMYSGQNGYTYIGTSCPVTPTYACYVNVSTNDYKWATTSPGSGYVIDETINSSEECVAPQVPEEPEYCYKKIGNGTQNMYCFGTSEECTGYPQKVDDVNDSLNCTEAPACYQTTSGSYVTGMYSGQNGYTYIGTSCPVTPTYACYVNVNTNDYKWATSSPGSGYVISPIITSASSCVAPKPSCYVNPTSGDYKWSMTSPGAGYVIDSTITSEASCKKPIETPTYACYVNESTNDYKWATSSPGSGYVVSATITSEGVCVAPTYACYINQATGDYRWSTTSPGSGYVISSTITEESECTAPTPEEIPACYEDADGNYVWGTYGKYENYTLITKIDNEEDCKKEIDVPLTSANVGAIVYISVVLMVICGSVFIYFVYKKKKNN